MSETKYRLTIHYRRLRPYYPLSYIQHQISKPWQKEYFQSDIDDVGVVKQLVIGPHSKVGTVKAQRTRALNAYPLANIWGSNEVEEYGVPNPGYEIVDEVWEMGVVRTDWIELDTPQ